MAKRQSIMWPGFAHSNPIPNASRIGNIVMSSVIGPRDPETGKVPETLEEQVKNLFLQLSAAIKAAGGTPDDFLKIEFWARDQAAGRAGSTVSSRRAKSPRSNRAEEAHAAGAGAQRPNQVSGRARHGEPLTGAAEGRRFLRKGRRRARSSPLPCATSPERPREKSGSLRCSPRRQRECDPPDARTFSESQARTAAGAD